VLPCIWPVITTDATMIVLDATKRNTLGRVKTKNIRFPGVISARRHRLSATFSSCSNLSCTGSWIVREVIQDLVDQQH
jgi:hypothetical protein